MNEPIEFRNKIINGIGIIPETAELNAYEYEYCNQFWILEGEDLLTRTDIKFLIYNCSDEGSTFNKVDYAKVIERERENSFFTPVMIFKNLDQESKIRTQVYTESRTANEKKLINKYFDEKIAIYTEISDSLEIEVEQKGINFLEYDTTYKSYDDEVNYLNGYVYNVSYFELSKVLNVTGKKLFRENVRVGLSNNKTGKKLKKAFKDYIKVGMYYKFMKDSEIATKEELLKERLELDDNIIKISSPDKFWFYHNGVTIFSYSGKKINRSNNRIKLNPNEVSIINGAQTVTNFYNAIDELKYDFKSIIKELQYSHKFDELWLEEKLSNICEEIKIKTIIIDGSYEFVDKISIGLNTQIPIEDEDILAKSEEVEKINGFLKSESISITRVGEVSAESNLSVLEYIKKYLIIREQPGKSKNLNKKELDVLLKESIDIFLEKTFAKEMKVLIELDELWKGVRCVDEILSKENIRYKEYFKYGKNYFGSYLISKDITEIDEDNLYNLFNQFVKEFKSIKEEVYLDDFKKDDLYNKYKENIKLSQDEADEVGILSSINTESFCKYLNENIESRYTVSKVVSTYLTREDINIPYFRVIAVTGDKIKEAYPFPNRTFSELYQTKGEDQNVAHIEFKDSEFAKEIEKEFPVFVIRWENEKENSTRIESADIITNFSFKAYKQEAEKVFHLTKMAFEDGDESIFIKSSEGKKFHIRPKAINSEDTFEFSNGMQITKRTFWANKETIKELIDKLKYEDNITTKNTNENMISDKMFKNIPIKDYEDIQKR